MLFGTFFFSFLLAFFFCTCHTHLPIHMHTNFNLLDKFGDVFRFLFPSLTLTFEITCVQMENFQFNILCVPTQKPVHLQRIKMASVFFMISSITLILAKRHTKTQMKIYKRTFNDPNTQGKKKEEKRQCKSKAHTEPKSENMADISLLYYLLRHFECDEESFRKASNSFRQPLKNRPQ